MLLSVKVQFMMSDLFLEDDSSSSSGEDERVTGKGQVTKRRTGRITRVSGRKSMSTMIMMRVCFRFCPHQQMWLSARLAVMTRRARDVHYAKSARHCYWKV